MRREAAERRNSQCLARVSEDVPAHGNVPGPGGPEMNGLPRARLAVISMHTSPTAALGQSANGGMNVYIREVCRSFSGCDIATDVFTRRMDGDNREVEWIAPRSRVVYLPVGVDADKYGQIDYVDDFARGLIEFASRERVEYDVVYSHYWLSGLVAAQLRTRSDLAWVHTAHTLALVKNRSLAPGARAEPPERVLGERQIAAGADLLIASTVDEAADLVELYDADPRRVTVVAPGVDLATFRPLPREAARAQIGIPDGTPLLLFVGRLERLKGVDLILRAVSLLVVDYPDLRLLVVGEDSRDAQESEKERLRAIASKLGVAERAEFRGSVPHHALPSFYSAANVCLMPSYSESFGLVGLEAQACGCPVIAANVAGLVSVVRDGMTGFLVDVPDAGTYADRVRRLLDDRTLADQMGRRGVMLAQRFPWSATAGRVWAAMERLIAPPIEEAVPQG